MTAKTIEPPLHCTPGQAMACLCEFRQLRQWYEGAPAGDRFVYAIARYLPPRATSPLLRQLDELYDEGWLIYTTEKLPDGRFRYFVIKREQRLRPGGLKRFVPRAVTGGYGA